MGLFDKAKSDTASQDEGRVRLPPGQVATEKWPVLTYGETPQIETKDWRFRAWGLVEQEKILTWDDLLALPAARIICDMHCVTRWSKFDNEFEGAKVRDLLASLNVKPEARYVMVHGYGGYTTNVPIADLMDDDVLLAYKYDGKPLEADHGGPCRLLVPKLYLWKSAKWVNGLEFIEKDKPGFWERAGYHMYGDPWKEERHGWTW
jgi:DMSO/TMAO reductase YedYZ molybdopterin-dependent catalytic subunit